MWGNCDLNQKKANGTVLRVVLREFKGGEVRIQIECPGFPLRKVQNVKGKEVRFDTPRSEKKFSVLDV